MTNSFKDSGLGGMQLGRAEDDASGNIFKDSGLGGIGLERPGTSGGAGNIFKDSGLGAMAGLGPEEPPRAGTSNLFKDSGLGAMMGLSTDDDDKDDLRFVVHKLNEVLKTNYTLVTFDQKAGRDLLQVLNDVFSSLNPQMAVDVPTEDPQTCFIRMSDFLCSILNYKIQPQQMQDFQTALTTGEKSLVYPLLTWVLKRMKENEKRVYLAKYLIPVDVPEDVRASDDQVRDVWQQYTTLVESFKETHKAVDKLRNTSDTSTFKKEISQYETEKEQLKAIIQNTQKKLSKFPNQEKILKAAQGLRKHTDESRVLEERLQEQQALLRQAETKLRMCNQRLHEVQRDFGEMNVDKIIGDLEKEVQINQKQMEKLPGETSEYRERVNALKSVITELQAADILQEQVQGLEHEIQTIEENATPKMDKKDEESLGLFRKQANLVLHRKEAKMLELQAVKDQKLQLDAQLKAKEVELAGFKDSKILKGDEFRAYATQLRGKSNNYKRMKGELQEMKAELGILQRTEELLRQQSDLYEANLTQAEKERGIHGYRTTQEEMVQISETKALVDEQKTQTLEELSKVVQEFVSNIRERRNKLAPQILELRNTRQKSQAVEQEYQQKKEVYEGTEQELEAEISKLQSEVDTLQEECHVNESLYHRLNCQMTITEVAAKRVEDEKAFMAGGRKLSEIHKSYSEMFTSTMSQLENMSKQLRDRQADIEANHGSNLKQMQWFKNMKRILDCKIRVHKQAERDEKPIAVMGGYLAGGSTMAGVDRLIIEQGA